MTDNENRIAFLHDLLFDLRSIQDECNKMLTAKSRKQDSERIATMGMYFDRMRDTFESAVKK